MFNESGIAEPQDFFKRVDRGQLSGEITQEGKELKDELLKNLRGIHVSFTIDSYTYLHHHYIAGLLCAPQLLMKPLLVYPVQASNHQQSFSEAGAFFDELCEFGFFPVLVYYMFIEILGSMG